MTQSLVDPVREVLLAHVYFAIDQGSLTLAM